ncbi:MAG: hypothetical protein QOD00_1710 [Blastocatellia bacterium]|jgi:hypothetical protein|nr:hypothetical protein [Blastocatellia bacterium]
MLTREEAVARIQQLPPDQQAEAAQLALKVYGPAPQTNRFAETRYDPAAYIKKYLGWEPWSGDENHPGQQQVIDAYVLALRQQHERKAYEAGFLSEEDAAYCPWLKPGPVSAADLQYWQPRQTIKNRIRLEAGHTVGKTKLIDGLVNHFFDHFTPCVGYCFAPTGEQIHDLLFKEIKSDRRGKGLPGRVMDLEIRVDDEHFIKGKATNNASGSGTERAQGQHGKYNIYALDEAEGIADFVWNAIDSMTSGGISIVFMSANPRTRSSKFHKQKNNSNVKSFRISCIHHPNVVAGREVVPGAVKRQYVEEMIEKHCEVVTEHSEDDHTFDLPFPVITKDGTHPAGTIFKPNAEFLFRVLGIAPANISDKNLITVGRFEGACKREAPVEDPQRARMGVDVSRYGRDYGTLYIRHRGRVWRAAQFWQQDTNEYARVIKDEALKLAKQGVKSLHIRVDGGGGFGGGVIDKLKNDTELRGAFTDFRVYEVHFNATAQDEKSYHDLITQAMAEAAETLKGIRIERPPETLEADLCERLYEWVNHKGVDVKKLETKLEFRKPKRLGRSPDDGDGFVLSVAPDFLFKTREVGSLEFRI